MRSGRGRGGVVEIQDEELSQFHVWLQAKGDHPSVVLTLRWIAEFELFAEEDEEAFRELKAWLKTRNDPEAASTLGLVTWFEETVEPDPRLKQFHDWLLAKGYDRTAVLARWWIAEFEEIQKENPRSVGPAPTLH
jgi:hypothetical protein